MKLKELQGEKAMAKINTVLFEFAAPYGYKQSNPAIGTHLRTVEAPSAGAGDHQSSGNRSTSPW
jgi:hypothetical protein